MAGSGQLDRSFVLFHTQSARLELKFSGSPRKSALVISPWAETSVEGEADYVTDRREAVERSTTFDQVAVEVQRAHVELDEEARHFSPPE